MSARTACFSMSFVLSVLCSDAMCLAVKPPLPKHFVAGKIRVFYTTEGTSAVPQTDANANSTPDHVEDVAKQLWAAHQLFCNVLGFPDPFKSERYPGLTCVELRIWDRDVIGGGNGVAFESAQRARSIPDGNPEDRALVMSIGKHVDATKNITPAHEFFHLIQYSSTYFKNPWYLEGMTRWSEHALGIDGVGQLKYPTKGPWPHDAQTLPALFKLSYNAEFTLWNPIAVRTDRKGNLPAAKMPDTLRSLRYSNGKPVVADLKLNGPVLMRDILLELAKMDDVAMQELGYQDWSEANQRSDKNNLYIYQAIIDALRKHSPSVGRFEAKTK